MPTTEYFDENPTEMEWARVVTTPTSPHDLLALIGQELSQRQLLVSAVDLSTHSAKQSSAAKQPLVVGVSGGADSLCLLYALHSMADVWNLDIHVAHLNHNLRNESQIDAQFVTQTAISLSLPIHLGAVAAGQIEAARGGLETFGREVRYRFLCAVARSIGINAKQPIIAVAHHANDQAETILLHLVRGSGLRGLRGMDWVTYREGIRIVRPLLSCTKEQVLDFLRAHNFTWIEDETNQDQTILRNRIRHAVIPLLEEANPKLVHTLTRTSEVIRAELARTQLWDKATFQELRSANTTLHPEPLPDSSTTRERVVLNLVKLLEQDVATQRNVIRLAIQQVVDSSLQNVDFETVENLLVTLENNTQIGVTRSLHHSLAWTAGRTHPNEPLQLSIHRESSWPFEPIHPLLDRAWRQRVSRTPLPRPGVLYGPGGWALCVQIIRRLDLAEGWNENQNEWCAYMDGEQAGAPLLTTPQVGQEFSPLGLRGKHKMLGDLFTDYKIMRCFRSGWPVVVNERNQEVLWVCGLRLAEHVKVTDATESVLFLKWMRSEVLKRDRTESREN